MEFTHLKTILFPLVCMNYELYIKPVIYASRLKSTHHKLYFSKHKLVIKLDESK